MQFPVKYKIDILVPYHERKTEDTKMLPATITLDEKMKHLISKRLGWTKFWFFWKNFYV